MKLATFLLTGLIVLNTNLAFAHEGHDAEEKAKEHAEKHIKGVPNEVKNYFKKADIELVHRQLTADQVASIEKYAGTKPEDYFHTFLAYGTKKGKKVQVGASTLVKVEKISFAIIYSNEIKIKDIIPINVTGEFKDGKFFQQFKNKNHDQEFTVGKDIKFSGKDTETAKAISKAIKLDILTVQTLWGKAHSHKK